MKSKCDVDVRAAIGSEFSSWSGLLKQDSDIPEALLEFLEEKGLKRERVLACVEGLKSQSTAALIEYVLNSRDLASPELFTIQLRHSEDELSAASDLCANEDPMHRAIGVALLKRELARAFHDEAVKLVNVVAASEQDDLVLEQLAYAMNHLKVKERARLLERASSSERAKTREAVAFSICELKDDAAIALMIQLSDDSDWEVRNYAMYGLRRSEKDSVEIRRSFLERLNDAHKPVRQEAILGLAQLKDMRVLSALQESLSSEEDASRTTLQAAVSLGDSSLLPILKRLEATCVGEDKLAVSDAALHLLKESK